MNMEIAAMSMAMSQAQVMQQTSLAVTKKTMDTAEVQMKNLVEMLDTVSPPGLGEHVDVKA